MAEEKSLTENLAGFNWDNEVTEVNFFGEDTTVGEKTEESKKDEQEEEEKKTSKKEKEEELEIFKDLEGEEEKKTSTKVEASKEKEEDEDETVVETKPSHILDSLKNLGILELDEEETKEFNELEEEDQSEAIKDYFDKAVEDKFTESIKDLPESVKNIIRYANKGGNVDVLLANMARTRSTGLSDDMDVEDESNQESLVRQKLTEEEYDEDYINSQLEYLKDSGKLKVTAEKYFNTWKKNKELSDAAELKKIEKSRQDSREKQIAFKKEISKTVLEIEDINGFKLSKKDISELPDYITNQNVKLQDGRVITPFYRDFFEAIKDKNKLILMSKLLRTDFDFSQIEKAVDTKKTRELKENLQRQKDTKSIKSNTGSSQTPKRLIDLLE